MCNNLIDCELFVSFEGKKTEYLFKIIKVLNWWNLPLLFLFQLIFNNNTYIDIFA